MFPRPLLGEGPSSSRKHMVEEVLSTLLKVFKGTILFACAALQAFGPLISCMPSSSNVHVGSPLSTHPLKLLHVTFATMDSTSAGELTLSHSFHFDTLFPQKS